MALCGPGGRRFFGPNVYPEAPDGGWGWVVAVAFFLVEVFTYGSIKSFGIFLQDLMAEFGESNSRVSWIVSISVFVMTFNAPLSSVMTNRFGFRLVVMIGGLLISSGTIATSFTGSVNQMYITYGLVSGLGYCLTFLPTVTILSLYFTRRRSLVTAVASTGESLSMFALAPALSSLKDHVGWRHTMAVLGALQGTIIICGALLRPIIIKPIETHETETDGSSPREDEVLSTLEKLEDTNPEDCIASKSSLEPHASYNHNNELITDSVSNSDVRCLKNRDDSLPMPLLQEEAKLETEENCMEISRTDIKESEPAVENMNRDAAKQVRKDKENKKGVKTSKLLDFSILRERSFILYSLFGLFATLGFFAPQLYIIELSVSRGVERDRAAYMLSIMAVAEIFGRFSIGWVLSRKRFRRKKLLVLLGCIIMMSLDLVGFIFVTEFYGLAVCCALYGFFMGAISCTHIPLLAEEDVVGIERMSSAAGVYVFIQSFSGLAGPPLGGMLVDVTQNYGSAFWSCAAGMAVSAVFLGLVRPAKKGVLCKKRKSKRCDDILEVKQDSEENRGADKPDKRTDSPEKCSEADVHIDSNKAEATGDDLEVIRFA